MKWWWAVHLKLVNLSSIGATFLTEGSWSSLVKARQTSRLFGCSAAFGRHYCSQWMCVCSRLKSWSLFEFLSRMPFLVTDSSRVVLGTVVWCAPKTKLANRASPAQFSTHLSIWPLCANMPFSLSVAHLASRRFLFVFSAKSSCSVLTTSLT